MLNAISKRSLPVIGKILLPFAFLLSCLVANAYNASWYDLRERTITGKVTDENGEPLAGASITAKGASSGVTADDNGNFSITVPDNVSDLVISYAGYVQQEVTVRNRSTITVVLKSESAFLNEVTVIGYGTQRKADLTGSVSSVKGRDLDKLPTQRVDQALQGRAAGVSVQNTDGEPGGNVTIRIRGGNSINGGNNALVVIDGVQGGDISTLNPSDIQSIEVLKDASATAIYGARGANGVILVTTRKGATGKTSFAYNFNMGQQTVGKTLDLMNAGEYARKANIWAASQNGTPSSPIVPVLPFTQAQIAALDQSGGTDWQDELYRPAMIQNHQVSASGGSNNIRYFISGAYLDQNGILINTNYKRYSLRSNLDMKLTNWLDAGVNLRLVKDRGNVPPTGEGTFYGDILGQVVNAIPRFDPITPVYDANGNYNFRALRAGPDNTKVYANPDIWNPVATARETKAERNNSNVDISTFLDFKIMKGLNFRVTGGAIVVHTDAFRYYGTNTQPGRGQSGNGIINNDKTEFYQNSNILTYKTGFFGKDELTVTAVAEQQVFKASGLMINASGFSSDLTGINDLGGASLINARSNYITKQSINSYLGRINYVFDNKYMLTASVRADGSSVFGDNNKWGYFPSGALAWKISEEDFLKSSRVISDLKIRGSWGQTGNQGIAPYNSLATIASGFNYGYLGDGSTSIGYLLTRAANPNLKWETTTQSDIGLDIGLFNNRLTATIDVYSKKTTDLLLNKQVELYTGFTSILSNVGSIENKGLEISLGGRPIARPDFTWSTNANISFNKSKVLELSDGASFLPVITNTGGGYRIYTSGNNALKQIRVGQEMDVFLGYVVLGTWGTHEAAQAAAFGQAPGDTKFLDVNGDGRITRAADGQQVIGNANPDFIYGWTNNFRYKNFELDFLIQGTYGNDIFNAVRIQTESFQYGTSRALNNYWTPTNQNTMIPGVMTTQDRNALNLGPSRTVDATGGTDNRWSRYVEDGSYLRLKNITFTYHMPSRLADRLHISNLAVYVAAANVFTITRYSGYDPEVSSFNRGPRVRAGGLGIDLSNYPTARTFSFGINASF